MATITLNSQPVLSGTISMPRNGAWFADLQVSGEFQLSDTVTISDGAIPFLGASISGGPHAGRTHVRVVGGTGGLRRVLDPRHYRSASVNKILGDICSDAGERKSLLILPTIGLQKLSFWSRGAGTGGGAIAALAEHLGVVWRILPTGDIWIGDPDFALPAPAEYQILDRDPIDQSYTVAIDGLGLWVGMSQAAGTIRRIEYTIGDTMRARYWVD